MHNNNIKHVNDLAYREKLLLEQTEELTKTGSWELDLVTHALYWSNGVFKILEYEPQSFQVTFEKGLEVIHPDDRSNVLQALQDAIARQIPYQIEKKFITKNGTIKYIRSMGRVIVDQNNQPLKLAGVFQDITDSILAEKELKEANVRLEMVMQAGYESVWDYNPLTHEMYLGESFTQKFGLPVKDSITNNDYFNSLYHPDERDEVLSDFRYKTFQTKETNWQKEFRFKKTKWRICLCSR